MFDLFEPLLPGGLVSQPAGTHVRSASFDSFLNKAVTTTASLDAILSLSTIRVSSFDGTLLFAGSQAVDFDALLGTSEPSTLFVGLEFDGLLGANVNIDTTVSFDAFLFRWFSDEATGAGLWGAKPVGTDPAWITRAGVVSGFHDERGTASEGAPSGGGSGGTGGSGGSGEGGSEPPPGGGEGGDGGGGGDDPGGGGEDQEPPVEPPPGPDAFIRFTKTVSLSYILFARETPSVSLGAVLASPASTTTTVDAILAPAPGFSGAFSTGFDT